MIGIFDSGMGGLTVWREIRRTLPGESLLYFGDGLHCPYGTKRADEVLEYIDAAVAELLARGAKMIVLACNTATVVAVNYLRAKYPSVPIVGMEPAIKPAVENTRTGVVGVLATRGTIESEWFRERICSYENRARIVTSVGEGWVEAVENGTKIDVREAVEPLIEAGADQIVLGCTHYPFLRREIETIAGANVNIIDPAPAVASRVDWLLNEKRMRSETVPTYEFMTAWDAEYLAKLIDKAEHCLYYI